MAAALTSIASAPPARIGDRPAEARRTVRVLRPEPPPVAVQRELDQLPADRGEVVTSFRRHRREEADRREPGDGVDLGQIEPIPGEEEIDPRETLGTYRAIGVSRVLEDRGAEVRRDLGVSRGLGQARRVLRLVVVELVPGDDLARAIQLAVCASAIPTELPSRAGLIISRSSPVPVANAASSPRTASRPSFQRSTRTSRWSTTGRPSPRQRRFW